MPISGVMFYSIFIYKRNNSYFYGGRITKIKVKAMPKFISLFSLLIFLFPVFRNAAPQ
jgi:hypothetical protein